MVGSAIGITSIVFAAISIPKLWLNTFGLNHCSSAYRNEGHGRFSHRHHQYCIRCHQHTQAVVEYRRLSHRHHRISAPSAIPMDPKSTWDQQQDDIPLVGREIKLYQRAIGQLMYLMLATRPDIAYAVTKLAQLAATPTNRHWAGVLKIMRYLRAHNLIER